MSWTRFLISAAFFTTFVHEKGAGGAITTQPVSTSVPLEETALFTCSGEGVIVFWLINDQAHSLPASRDRGVVVDEDVNPPLYVSNLTIPGTVENDNVSIQCGLVVGAVTELSSIVYLTVLGIGNIASVNVSFLPSIPCIQWVEPSFISSDVSSIMYSVSVDGANMSPINATTSDTEYCLEFIPCQKYTVTVTPFSISPDYTANSANMTNTIPGDNYRFKGPCSSEVVFESNSTNVSCTFRCQLQVPSAVCPGQTVQVVVGSYLNDNIVMTHPLLTIDDLAIHNDEFLDIAVTDLPVREPYYSNLSLFSKDSVFVSGISQNFTTYSVQDVIMVNFIVTTEICMECVFAVNAPAQGCLVLFSNFSSVIFNVTILRTTSAFNASSCSPVPDFLSRQTVHEFIVSVYDYEGDGALNLSEPALILPELLQVEPIVEMSTIDSSSFIPQMSTLPGAADGSSGQETSSSALPSVGTGPPQDLSTEVIVSVVVVLVIILGVVLILVLVGIIAFKKRLYHKFGGETMNFVSSPSHSPRLIEITEVDNGNLSEPSIGQEIKSPIHASGLESSSQPPPSYPAPCSEASSSNVVSRNPVYDDLAKFSSKPKTGSVGNLQYADLGPRLDGGPVHFSEEDRVKYSSLQHPSKKVEYAVLQKPPKKRPPVKHDTEKVTYVQILPKDQHPTGTGGTNDDNTSAKGGSSVGSSQPGILTALHAPVTLGVDRHIHSHAEFSSMESSVHSSTTGGPRPDLQKPFLPPESPTTKDVDNAGVDFVELANRELELTEFVSGGDGDTLPRTKTDSDQLRGRTVDKCASIPLQLSILPFVSMGDDHSDLMEDLTEKAFHNGSDILVSFDACSEVTTLAEASQCVDVLRSSMVVPEQSMASFFLACEHLYSSCDEPRNLSSTHINQAGKDLVPVPGTGNDTSSTASLDKVKVPAE